MLHSLRLRLLLMFIAIAIVSIAIAQIYSIRATVDAFNAYAVRIQAPYAKNQSLYIGGLTKNTRTLIITLLNLYRQQQDPQSTQTLLEQIGKENQLHILLVDNNQRILADSARTLNGQELATAIKQETPAHLLTKSQEPVIIISTSMLAPPASASPLKLLVVPGSPEENFFASQKKAFWLAIVLASLVALLLSWLCSNMILTPIKTLTHVVNHMEHGDFNKRVHIRTKTEIGMLARAFNTMADSLARQEQLRRNLVSDVAHELRTPLTNIRGYLEAIQDQVIEPSLETLASLYEEALLLTRLVADLQDLSLAEAGQLHLLCKPIAIDGLIAKTLNALQPLTTEKQIFFHVDIPPYLPAVQADPERVGQILRNLLNNAIRHSPPGGQIIVSAYIKDNETVICVQDAGEGISEQHLPYIFERFYRADPSRSRETGGTGLGLAIVKQMVQAHGGYVSVESQPGQGSCFSFTLPITAKST